MEKIKAFIVNRNLLTPLKNTVNFLLKEPRVEVIIYDQQSTYPPLLQYYQNNYISVVHAKQNDGPKSIWGEDFKPHFNKEHFILADSDCTYDGIPEDWLDRMLHVLKDDDTVFKVGFSIETDDLPDTNIAKAVIDWEKKHWAVKTDLGWKAAIDTTFALYRPDSGFSYDAIRLDRPYCMKHSPWYVTKDNVTEEWLYYLEHASGISSWGSRIRKSLNLPTPPDQIS